VYKRQRSSLSLVRMNQKNGQLKVVDKNVRFEGVLPEDAIFDHEGKNIAVAVYHNRDEGHPTQGWIDFWEIENDKLILTNTKLKVTRGVHNLLLIPQS